jgi:hypothetical protein
MIVTWYITCANRDRNGSVVSVCVGPDPGGHGRVPRTKKQVADLIERVQDTVLAVVDTRVGILRGFPKVHVVRPLLGSDVYLRTGRNDDEGDNLEHVRDCSGC